MSFVDDYFSIYALLVLFRESIEASIVVSVLLQFLQRTFPQLKKQVWWGVAAGGSGAILFGIVFVAMFYVARNNAFKGPDKSIFQGCVAWFAGILITFLAFAMLRYKGWEDKIARKLHAKAQEKLNGKGGTESDIEAPEPTTRLGRAKARVRSCMTSTTQPIVSASAACWGKTSSAASTCWGATSSACSSCWTSLTSTLRHPFARWLPPPTQPESKAGSEDPGHPVMELGSSHGYAMFTVVAITVLREGIESVIFLAGVGNAEPRSLPLPGLVGLLMGITVGIFLYYTGRQVKDIKYFLILMSLILFFIAGGQFMLGTLFLSMGGMFGYQSPWINQRPWYMKPVYDWSKCCPDNIDGETAWYQFLSLMKAIFGYQAQPSMLQLTVYYSYWFIVICAAIYKWWNGSLFDADWKYKKQMKKLEAEKQKALELQQQPSDVLHPAATGSTELGEQAILAAKLKGLTEDKYMHSTIKEGREDHSDVTTTDSVSTASGTSNPTSSSSQALHSPLTHRAPQREVAGRGQQQ